MSFPRRSGGVHVNVADDLAASTFSWRVADLVQRADYPLVAAAPDERGARGGGVQAQDDPHRGGLARAVRPEEAGHVPGANREAQTVQRGDRAEALAELIHLDHDWVPRKKALELPRQRNTTVPSPISQMTNQKIFTSVASGTTRLPSASIVAMPKSTVPVIRAQLLPLWQFRAMKIHSAAATRPLAIQPTISGRSCAVSWLAVRFGNCRFMAFFVAVSVVRSMAMPMRLATAPAYMSLTALRTEPGAGGRWTSGIWAPPG